MAEQDGEIIGIAGVLHSVPKQAFSDIGQALRNYPREVVKGVRLYREILNSYDEPIYAIANPTEETAVTFLTHVGFEHLEDRIYRWKV